MQKRVLTDDGKFVNYVPEKKSALAEKVSVAPKKQEAAPTTDWESYSIAELKGFLDAKGIQYKSQPKKAELVALLVEDSSAGV